MPHLTFKLGLRLDKNIRTDRKYGFTHNGFDTTTANPISAATIAAYGNAPNALLPASQFSVNGGLTFAGSSNRQFAQFPSTIVSPRFGFSWKPSFAGQETVVRGGFVLPIFPFNNSIPQIV